MVKEEIATGKILLAEPFMEDPNFKRSVVLLCEHNELGSLGFILNRPLNMAIDELMEDFPEFNASVYYGGPVQTNTVHYIHTKGDILDESIAIENGLYWGGDFEKLKFLISTQLIGPADIRFFVGYSGWSEGQLVDETSYGSWIVSKMDANYLFKVGHQQLWSYALSHKGDVYSVIAQMPDHISQN